MIHIFAFNRDAGFSRNPSLRYTLLVRFEASGHADLVLVELVPAKYWYLSKTFCSFLFQAGSHPKGDDRPHAGWPFKNPPHKQSYAMPLRHPPWKGASRKIWACLQMAPDFPKGASLGFLPSFERHRSIQLKKS